MKITSFSPLIMTNDAENIQRLFEEFGFVTRHEKKDIAGTNHSGGLRMKDAEGHTLSIAHVSQISRDVTAIQMNVDNFEEAIEFLTARGFYNMQGEGNVFDTGSSKTAIMCSPSGFAINVVYHIKDR